MTKATKKVEDIQPFYIDCRWLTEQHVKTIIEKMIDVGIKEYDNLTQYDWDEYPLWGYSEKFGTYTNSRDSRYYLGAIEIQFEDLDEHLGLHSETECPLRNVKINLRKEDGTVDEELSRAFQDAVVSSGGRWYNKSRGYRDLVAPFIFVDCSGYLSFSMSENKFTTSGRSQITFSYEHKLEWKAEYVQDEDEERNVVEIGGKKYYEDELSEALSNIKEID